ncbi:MAG: hypothetical protein HY716_10625 [Planctomycetes bacterium]|nr:hypothetical protein [Planctomycetota bacterium]
MKPILFLTGLLLASCSGSYKVRLVDDRSIAYGTESYFAYAVPPLLPGQTLADVRPDQRLVIWSEDGFEAILDGGDPRPVLVREGPGARPASPADLERLARVFPEWSLVPSPGAEAYAAERARAEPATSGGLFPTHIRECFDRAEPSEAIRLALDRRPPGWMDRGGRAVVLAAAAARCAPSDLRRIVDQALIEPFARDGRRILRACTAREDLPPADLAAIMEGLERRSELDASWEDRRLAVRHPSATEALLLRAAESLKRPMRSTVRRAAVEAIASTPAATSRVLLLLTAASFHYDEDREAAILRIVSHPSATAEVRCALRKIAERIRDPERRSKILGRIEAEGEP